MKWIQPMASFIKTSSHKYQYERSLKIDSLCEMLLLCTLYKLCMACKHIMSGLETGLFLPFEMCDETFQVNT